jgi:2-polyprenyl-3-methyl-5-hydroxy-6-metoxy-1,4-benzoquinol methylase
MVIDPFPSETQLHSIYNESYYKNSKLTSSDENHIYGYFDYISERINKQKGYAKVCRRIRKYQATDIQNASLLDYGCGLGHFLDSAYEYDFKVAGVEFNPFAVEYIQKRYRYPILSDGEYERSGERYDVITVFDVIEHVRNPFTLLKDISGRLHDNGLVVVSTTDAGSLTSRMLGRRLEDFRRIREHLFFFNRRNLSEILIQNDFEILEISSLGHSFEIALLASRLKNALPVLGGLLNALLFAFPFLKSMSIYLNPRTKFIIYARKKYKPLPDDRPDKTISIIMPVYNEWLYIEKVIEKLLAVDIGLKKEIIIVNDGSTDQTSEKLKRYEDHPSIRVFHKKNEGKGSAVALGIAKSTGDFVIIQDADLEYNPEDIKTLLDTMYKAEARAVYGTRYMGQRRRTGYFVNTLANNFLTFLANFINNLNLTDMETGYKLFHGPVIRSIKITAKGFDFEPEVTCKIARLKIPIYETPISYNARTYYEGKKIKFIDGLKAILALIKYGILRYQ